MSTATISAPPVTTPGPAAPTIPCSWAACSRGSRITLDGWRFCFQHGREHNEMRRRGDLRGQHPAPTKDVDPRPNHLLTRAELLKALLVEVQRPVPPTAAQIEQAKHNPRTDAGRRPRRAA